MLTLELLRRPVETFAEFGERIEPIANALVHDFDRDLNTVDDFIEQLRRFRAVAEELPKFEARAASGLIAATLQGALQTPDLPLVEAVRQEVAASIGRPTSVKRKILAILNRDSQVKHEIAHEFWSLSDELLEAAGSARNIFQTAIFDNLRSFTTSIAPQVEMKAANPSGEDQGRWVELHAFLRAFQRDEQAIFLFKPGTQNTSVRPEPSCDESTQSENALEEVIAELDSFVGMSSVKKDVRSLISFLKVERLRSERGFSRNPVSLHSVFTGPPGTGKTSIARIMGRVYKALGFLKKGHVVETDRAGLVAGYIGQTAIKADEIIARAKDGILLLTKPTRSNGRMPPDGTSGKKPSTYF
jgi:ATPase family associated with various cellular activities (AAA)